MKLSKIILASAITMAFALNTNAADYGTHNGTVTFNGRILETPCSVSQNDLQQTVEFGEISKAVLESGETSNIRTFDITLKNCTFDVSTTTTIVFNGGTAAGTNDRLALNGGATGAGIAVEYAGSKIKFDGETPAVDQSVLANGDNNFTFTTYVEKLPSATAINVGEFSTTANFVISYI